MLGDGCELALAAELAGVELAEARRAAAELAAADVLEDAAAPRFRHPLVRAAVTERLPAVELGRAHAGAARLLADREAPPGAIAAHLLLAPPAGEAWVPESLRHAARDARGQGAPELAAAYLRRALAEPPADRTAVLLELGRAEHAAGASEAASRLETAWRATDDPQIALELATLLYEQGRWREATTVARDALAAVTGAARAAPSDDEARARAVKRPRAERRPRAAKWRRAAARGGRRGGRAGRRRGGGARRSRRAAKRRAVRRPQAALRPRPRERPVATRSRVSPATSANSCCGSSRCSATACGWTPRSKATSPSACGRWPRRWPARPRPSATCSPPPRSSLPPTRLTSTRAPRSSRGARGPMPGGSRTPALSRT